MNKTISINLGGIFFVVNENAYAILKQYIEALEKKYANARDGKEIVNDIESRMAELFTQKMGNVRNVVELNDVNYVIQTLGRPEDFDNAEEDEFVDNNNGKSNTNQQQNASSGSQGTSSKRLYRNPDDKVIMGVASGLSAYLGINDPVWLRIILVLLGFVIPGVSTSFVVMAYILLGVILPEAKTTAEKLEMRGEAINLDNIEKSFSGAFNNERKTAIGNFFNRLGEILNQLFSAIGPVLTVILKIFAVLCLIIALLVVGSLFISLMAAVPFLHQAQLFTGFHNVLFSSSVFLSFGLPLIISILGLGAWLFKTKLNKGIWWALLITCIISWVVMFYYVSIGLKSFSNESSVKEKIELSDIQGDTLYIANMPNDVSNKNFFGLSFNNVKFDFNKIYNDNARMDVRKNTSDKFELLLTKTSRGENEKVAQSYSSGIQPQYKISGDTLYLSRMYNIDKKTPWRFQDLNFTLLLPEGKSIHLTESAERVIYDIKNSTNTKDEYMISKTWTMLANGLTCVNCKLPSYTSLSGNDFEDGSELDMSNFKSIKVKGAFDLKVIQSDEFSVKYQPNGDNQDKINIHQEGNELIVESNTDKVNLKNGELLADVIIRMPKLKSMDIQGLNTIDIEDFSDESTELELKGANSIKIDGNYDALTINNEGASKMKLKGSAQNLTLHSEGGSLIDADRMVVDNGTFHIEGGGKADVNVTNNLVAKLFGIVVFSYTGNPQNTTIKDDGLSNVNKK